MYQKALAIREKALGPEDPNVSVTLNNLAALYDALGQYDQARPLYERALAIREKVWGPEDQRTASVLNNLAALLETTGDYEAARPLYERALAVREKTLGPDHPLVAESLNNLALLHDALGDYDRALELYQRSLGILEKSLGPDNPETAVTLNNLAELYVSLGELDRAKPLYERALAIREKALGPEHADTAQSLNNLAILYESQGNYTQAESYYRQAVEVWEKALGPDHPETASGLNNLAEFYKTLGDFKKAEPLYDRALAIREKVLGPDHPAVAVSLNNLAGLYEARREYDRARPLLERAARIWEKALGPEHPHLAVSLANLADLDMTAGDLKKSRALYQRALEIRERAYGPDHPDVADTLANMAGLEYADNNLAGAIELYDRAVAILEKSLGPDHPRLGRALTNRAVLLAADGKYQEAFTNMEQALTIDRDLIGQVLGFTSEAQKFQFLAGKKLQLDAFLSLAAWHLADDAAARQAAFDVWLTRKGILLETQRRFQEALFYADEPEARAVFEELSRVRARISHLTFGSFETGAPEKTRAELADLEKRKQDLEARLSRLSQAFARQEKVRRADAQTLARSLPPDTALMDFAEIRPFDFAAGPKGQRWEPARYLAFILKAGQKGDVDLLDLGEAQPIDTAVSQLQTALADTSPGSEKVVDQANRRLYDLIFPKPAAVLGDIREIYISPDGELNLIPFEILKQPNGRSLIEDYTFYYLSAGRDLLGFGTGPPSEAKALLLGDPDFDSTTGQAGPATPQSQGLHFLPLPGTRAEVEDIYKLLGPDQAELFTGAAADESVFMDRPAPKILHLATHGFYFPDPKAATAASDTEGTRGFGLVPTAESRTPAAPANPLLRCGLALAGANHTAGNLNEALQSDGLLTAEKVLNLKLRGSELVVLSACDTGLGDVESGEGVSGLRRAFIRAGARSLIMSLWSVPDQETRELMVNFYRILEEGELNRGRALRQAVLEEIALVDKRYGHDNPLYWGAFIFLGEP